MIAAFISALLFGTLVTVLLSIAGERRKKTGNRKEPGKSAPTDRKHDTREQDWKLPESIRKAVSWESYATSYASGRYTYKQPPRTLREKKRSHQDVLDDIHAEYSALGYSPEDIEHVIRAVVEDR